MTGYGRHRKLGVGFRTAGYGQHSSQWVNALLYFKIMENSGCQREKASRIGDRIGRNLEPCNWLKNNNITIDIIYYLRSQFVSLFTHFSFQIYFSTAKNRKPNFVAMR